MAGLVSLRARSWLEERRRLRGEVGSELIHVLTVWAMQRTRLGGVVGWAWLRASWRQCASLMLGVVWECEGVELDALGFEEVWVMWCVELDAFGFEEVRVMWCVDQGAFGFEGWVSWAVLKVFVDA